MGFMIYLDRVILPVHLGTIFIWISACITESNIQKWTINTKLKLNWNWISDNLYKTARSHLRQVTGWGIKQCIEQMQSDTRTCTHTHTHTHTQAHAQAYAHKWAFHSRQGPPKLLLFVGNSCYLGAYWRMLCFVIMIMMMMMKIKMMTIMMMMTWWW